MNLTVSPQHLKTLQPTPTQPLQPWAATPAKAACFPAIANMGHTLSNHCFPTGNAPPPISQHFTYFLIFLQSPFSSGTHRHPGPMSSTASGHQGLEFSTPSQTPLHTGFNLPDMVQAFLILQVHGGAILPVMPPSSATQSIQLCACDMTAAWLVFLFWSNE